MEVGSLYSDMRPTVNLLGEEALPCWSADARKVVFKDSL